MEKIKATVKETARIKKVIKIIPLIPLMHKTKTNQKAKKRCMILMPSTITTIRKTWRMMTSLMLNGVNKKRKVSLMRAFCFLK